MKRTNQQLEMLAKYFFESLWVHNSIKACRFVGGDSIAISMLN